MGDNLGPVPLQDFLVDFAAVDQGTSPQLLYRWNPERCHVTCYCWEFFFLKQLGNFRYIMSPCLIIFDVHAFSWKEMYEFVKISPFFPTKRKVQNDSRDHHLVVTSLQLCGDTPVGLHVWTLSGRNLQLDARQQG